MQADPALLESLIDTLTYRIEVKGGARGGQMKIETIRNYSVPKAGVIAIPSGRTDLIPEHYEIEDRRTVIPVDFPDPLIPLREAQVPIYQNWPMEGSGILNAKPGWGKTFTGLHLAYLLGQKTLVIAHTAILRDQWIEEVETLFGFRPGVISADEFNLVPPIVIGNVQSVTKRAVQLADCFGTVITDECHHTPATTFSQILEQSKAKYKLGLSGTLKRKDKRHVLFPDYFGKYVVSPPAADTMTPKVKIVKTDIKLGPGDWATKITNLHEDPEYVELITIIAATQMAKGHKVLVVADRVEFLYNIASKLGDRARVVVGDSKQEDRDAALEAMRNGDIDCIAGSRQIFAEGVSCNPLSCLVLATPYASEPLLEQLIGRVQRPHPGKLEPLVIDINFPGYTIQKQNNLRLSFYFDQGLEVSIV